MKWLLDKKRAFGEDKRGGVAIVGAATMMLFVVLAALSIDLGSITLKAREIQGAADLAALSAARNLPKATAAANATARANLGDDVTITTETGVYSANAAVAVHDRFVSGSPTPNAARVTIKGEAPLYFAGIIGFKTAPVTRKATAALPGSQASALFSIGSRLASVNRGLVNSLLTGLLGSNINLNVMDYNSLVATEVNLLEFLDALAVNLNVEAGDYDALLKHEVTSRQVLRVLEVLADDRQASVLGMITGARLDVPLTVGDIVGVDVNAKDGLRRALNVDVAALDILMAGLETANGNRQLQLGTEANAILADVKVYMAIGERPNDSAWITVASGRTPVIHTAQTRLHVTAKTKNLVPQLLEANIELFAELASAEARISSIKCAPTKQVKVEARTGALRVTLGEVENPADLKNFKTPIRTRDLTLATVLFLPLDVYANLQSHDVSWQELTFNETQIENKTHQTVRSKEIGSSLVNNLMKDLKINFLGLQLEWIVKLLGPLLVPVGYILDSILNPLLRLLGVGLGEADVRVLGVTCPGDIGCIPYLVG